MTQSGRMYRLNRTAGIVTVSEVGERIVVTPSTLSYELEMKTSNGALILVNGALAIFFATCESATGRQSGYATWDVVPPLIFILLINTVLVVDRLCSQRWHESHGEVSVNKQTRKLTSTYWPDESFGPVMEVRIYVRWLSHGGHMQTRLALACSAAEDYVVMDSPRYASYDESRQITSETLGIPQRYNPAQEDWRHYSGSDTGMTAYSRELVAAGREIAKLLDLPEIQ